MTLDSIPHRPLTPWGRARAWSGRMYARVESYANSPAAFSALLVVAAIDSAFFPVPPFVLLIPMVIASPHRWLRLTLWSTLASLAGSLWQIANPGPALAELYASDPALAQACVDLTPRLRRTAEILLAGLIPSRTPAES